MNRLHDQPFFFGLHNYCQISTKTNWVQLKINEDNAIFLKKKVVCNAVILSRTAGARAKQIRRTAQHSTANRSQLHN